MPQIRNAYRRLALEYHPDKNISSKDGMKFKLITEAYQTLRVKNMNASVNFNSVYDGTNVNHFYKKIKSWYYLNIFYVIADYAKKMRYMKTVYGYLLEYKPILMACGLILERVIMPVCRLITPKHVHVNSFISYIQYGRLTRSLLTYLGIRS